MICYLGLDIGTTGIKAVVFNQSGLPMGSGLAEYRLETPAPDIVEFPAEQYWLSLMDAVAGAVKQAGIEPSAIRSLSVTGQAETLIMTDQAGKSLRKAIVWLDNRAGREAREIEEHFGAEELFRMSGQTEMLPCWPAAKILWYRRYEPELFARTARFLMVEDYIIHKLTGRYITSRGLMPSSLYYDIRSGGYDPAMLEYLEVSPGQLPELADSGEVIGACIPNDSVIPPGAVVAGASIDHVCGSFGCGCVRAGRISETTGCTLALCASYPGLVYDEQRRLSTYLGFLPGSYVLLPWAPTAGIMLKHFRDEFAADMDYRDFDRLAAEIPAGSDGLLILPHLAGAVSPVCNPHARGVAYGISLNHGRAHWIRSMMESVAFLLRDNVEALRSLGGEFTELCSLGGASRSRLWLQIKADVMQMPVSVSGCSEAVSLGAAMLGAVACGDFRDCAEVSEQMVKIKEVIVPGENAGVYQEYFNRYQSLNRVLMPTFGGDHDVR